MNHPFVMDCARALIRRPEIASERETAKKVDRLHRLLYARFATPEEQWQAREYLQVQGNAPAAWESYAHALLLVNEFVIVD
jgi:hypothetical protein